MLYCTSLLPLVIVGVGLFYAGLTQRRSSLTIIGLPVILTGLVFIDWFIWGYSLCYSTSSNEFIGNFGFVVLRQLRDPLQTIYTTPRGDILSFNHFVFNGLFKCICACLTFPGCIAERGRVVPMLVFLFFWSCIIYNPVTYWFWNLNGWLSSNQLKKFPVLDFAGGSPIHIVSGFTVLAYSYILGPRNPKILYNYRATNTGWIILGTFITLCGWIGFITGCDYQFLLTSGYIMINTILCGNFAGLLWMTIDYFLWVPAAAEDELVNQESNATGIAPDQPIHNANYEQQKKTIKNAVGRRKISLVSFSTGVMTGLVVITPAGGFISSSVEFWKCFVFALVGVILANLSTRLKYYLNIDDAFDVFAIHGVAGIVGSILTGIFAGQKYGSNGGWVEGNWKQIAYQILGCVVTASYAFIMTCVLLYIIDFIPTLHLRIDKDFNKRMRKQNKLLSEGSDEVKIGGGETEIIGEGERLEILGSDNYELNGEFLMDFMEFIKVIQPDDYEEEEIITGDEEYIQNLDIGQSSDYKPHEGYISRTRGESYQQD